MTEPLGPSHRHRSPLGRGLLQPRAPVRASGAPPADGVASGGALPRAAAPRRRSASSCRGPPALALAACWSVRQTGRRERYQETGRERVTELDAGSPLVAVFLHKIHRSYTFAFSYQFFV